MRLLNTHTGSGIHAEWTTLVNDSSPQEFGQTERETVYTLSTL